MLLTCNLADFETADILGGRIAYLAYIATSTAVPNKFPTIAPNGYYGASTTVVGSVEEALRPFLNE